MKAKRMDSRKKGKGGSAKAGESAMKAPSPSTRKSIRVVGAVIIEGGKVFATQRGYGDFKDMWEFPGGKIEKGETPQQALEREIREELDTEVSVGERLGLVEYDYPDFHISLDCYVCSIVKGDLHLREHEAASWLDKDSLDSVAWLPADLSLIEKLKEFLRGM